MRQESVNLISNVMTRASLDRREVVLRGCQRLNTGLLVSALEHL